MLHFVVPVACCSCGCSSFARLQLHFGIAKRFCVCRGGFDVSGSNNNCSRSSGIGGLNQKDASRYVSNSTKTNKRKALRMCKVIKTAAATTTTTNNERASQRRPLTKWLAMSGIPKSWYSGYCCCSTKHIETLEEPPAVEYTDVSICMCMWAERSSGMTCDDADAVINQLYRHKGKSFSQIRQI